MQPWQAEALDYFVTACDGPAHFDIAEARAAMDNPPDACCGTCYCMRRKGNVFTVDHCKREISPFVLYGNAEVGEDWWCPLWEPRVNAP